METSESSSPDAEAEKQAFKEKLRSLTWGKVPGGTRSSMSGRGPDTGVYRNRFHANWEKGIKGEDRRDGSFMPYVNANGDPIRMKDWSENRHKYEAKLTEVRSKPTED